MVKVREELQQITTENNNAYGNKQKGLSKQHKIEKEQTLRNSD